MSSGFPGMGAVGGGSFRPPGGSKSRFGAVSPLPYAHGKDKTPPNLFPERRRVWIITVLVVVAITYLVLSRWDVAPATLHPTPASTAAAAGSGGRPAEAPAPPPPVWPTTPEAPPPPARGPEAALALTPAVEKEHRLSVSQAPAPAHLLPLDEHAKQFATLVRELDAHALSEEAEKEMVSAVEVKEFKKLAERVRAFRVVFERWERVHLAWDATLHKAVKPAWVVAELGSGQVGSRTYEQYRRVVNAFTENLFPFIRPRYTDLLGVATQNQGRGIVMSAGNHHADFLLVLLRLVREVHKCTLPIEVVYLGDNDITKQNRDALEKIPGVRTVDLFSRISDVEDRLSLRGWAGKPAAIFASSFQEVVFVDADVVFLQDPTLLFSDPQYVQTGSLFYLDRVLFPDNGRMRDWLTSIMPEPIPETVKTTRFWKKESSHQQESGVLVVDKTAHGLSLLTVVLLNGAVRDEITYKYVFGDKETFWIGYELAGDSRYAFQSKPAGSIGPVELSEKDNNDRVKGKTSIICAPQLLHFDHQGKPMWFNGWIMKSKFVKEQTLNTFEVYLSEPGEWQLKDANRACLNTDTELLRFDEREKAVLSQIRPYYEKYSPVYQREHATS